MSDFPDVRRALDAVPVPPLPPVDVAAIYHTALESQARSARRWKRVAAGVSALAAGVLAFALIPNLELRWKTPPMAVVVPPATPPDPRVAELIDEQRKLFALLRDSNAKHADLQDLLLTLARDVADRDTGRRNDLAELAAKLREFETVTARQFQESERTNTALYNVVFAAKPKGDQP
jgi:hypothetical protein